MNNRISSRRVEEGKVHANIIKLHGISPPEDFFLIFLFTRGRSGQVSLYEEIAGTLRIVRTLRVSARESKFSTRALP